MLQVTEDSPFQNIVVAFLRTHRNVPAGRPYRSTMECADAARIGLGFDFGDCQNLAGADNAPVHGRSAHVVSPHLLVEPESGEQGKKQRLDGRDAERPSSD